MQFRCLSERLRIARSRVGSTGRHRAGSGYVPARSDAAIRGPVRDLARPLGGVRRRPRNAAPWHGDARCALRLVQIAARRTPQLAAAGLIAAWTMSQIDTFHAAAAVESKRAGPKAPPVRARYAAGL